LDVAQVRLIHMVIFSEISSHIKLVALIQLNSSQSQEYLVY
jgi:hypothetical protein